MLKLDRPDHHPRDLLLLKPADQLLHELHRLGRGRHNHRVGCRVARDGHLRGRIHHDLFAGFFHLNEPLLKLQGHRARLLTGRSARRRTSGVNSQNRLERLLDLLCVQVLQLEEPDHHIPIGRFVYGRQQLLDGGEKL